MTADQHVPHEVTDMINISKQMKIAACAGVFGAAAAYLLDVYIKMTVSNLDLHFLFGYLDGVIVMGMIMVYMKRCPATSQAGGT